MVYVPQIGQSLTLATLISERCRVLGLSQAEFVNRVGCQDIQKGIRLLNQLFDGDHTRTEALIEAISLCLGATFMNGISGGARAQNVANY